MMRNVGYLELLNAIGHSDYKWSCGYTITRGFREVTLSFSDASSYYDCKNLFANNDWFCYIDNAKLTIVAPIF